MLPVYVVKSYTFNYRPQRFQEVQKLQRIPESPYYIGKYDIFVDYEVLCCDHELKQLSLF
jgi:hypothetical protein